MMHCSRQRLAPKGSPWDFRAALIGLAASLIFVGVACNPPTESALCLAPPPPPAEHGLRETNIAVGFVGEGIRVRGFSNAARPATAIEVQLGKRTRQVEADANGRFIVDLNAEDISMAHGATAQAPTELQIREIDSDHAVSFRIRAEAAQECVVRNPLSVGTTPNDLVVQTCEEKSFAFVVHSTDGTVAGFSIEGEPPPPAVSFPVSENQRGANPWSIAFDDAGISAAVTLFGQNSVAWVTPCTGQIRSVTQAAQSDGSPLWLDISPPVKLDLALDVDGDGNTETDITRMLPRTPQGIVFADDRWLVTYTNLLQVGAKPVYGPGLVVAFERDDGKLVPTGHRVLPCTNPQSITLDPGGNPWVSCTGVLGPGPDGFAALSDGHLLRLSAQTLDVEATISMGAFGPGTPAFYDSQIVVGSLVRPRVAVLHQDMVSIESGNIVQLDEPDRVESVFETLPLTGGLVLVAEYGTDRLHVLDVEELVVNPWPFEDGIAVGPGGMAFRGLQSLALTPRDAAPAATADAFALLAQSHELVPLRLWQVMGP